MNVIFLSGNTGGDPVHSYTASGKLVVKFSFAVNRVYGEKEPDWFNIECWGKLAQTMKQYGFKGQELLIRGQVKTENYEKDGDTKYYSKVIAHEIDIKTWPSNEIAEEVSLQLQDLPTHVQQALQNIYA